MFSLSRFAVLMLAVFVGADLYAHGRSESFSTITVSAQQQSFLVDIKYSISLKEVLSIAPQLVQSGEDVNQAFGRYVVGNFRVTGQDQTCKLLDSWRVLSAGDNGFNAWQWSLLCPLDQTLRLNNTAVFTWRDNHMHIARLKLDGGIDKQRLLVSGQQNWALLSLTPLPISAKPAWQYLQLGAQHILSGYDHLAFLLAIVLLSWRLGLAYKGVILMVTGFTLGHSLTLVLAVLQWVSLSAWLVEALIAFSIVLVALEYHASAPNKLKLSLMILASLMLLLGWYKYTTPSLSLAWSAWFGLSLFAFCFLLLAAKSTNQTRLSKIGFQFLLTTLFGLIHGFGFAGSLQTMGLPEQNLLLALLSFNVGVELGQLSLLALAVLVLWFVHRLPIKLNYHGGANLSIAILAGLGLYWFLQRIV